MKDVPPEFIEAVKQGKVSVCELFEFHLTCGTHYYFTSFSEDIDWGSPSIRYRVLPIQRNEVNSSLNLEMDTVELQLAGITGELMDVAEKNILDNVLVVIKRALWDQNSASGMEQMVFLGTGTPSYNRNVVVLSCVSILDSLNIMAPRNLFQQPCNYRLFDVGCTLNMESYKVSSTATSDAPNNYFVMDSAFVPPPTDLKKFNLGELRVTSGNNLGIRRQILSTTTGIFVVSVPFPEKILAEDTFDYYPGCSKNPECCRDRFNNLLNFYGFVHLSSPEEVLF